MALQLKSLETLYFFLKKKTPEVSTAVSESQNLDIAVSLKLLSTW